MAKFPPLDEKTADFLRQVCQVLEKDKEWINTPEGQEWLRTPHGTVQVEPRWYTTDVKPNQFVIESGRCLVHYRGDGGYNTWGTRSPSWNNPHNIDYWMPIPLMPGGERVDGSPVANNTRTRRGNQIRNTIMSAIAARPLPAAGLPDPQSDTHRPDEGRCGVAHEVGFTGPTGHFDPAAPESDRSIIERWTHRAANNLTRRSDEGN